MRKDEVALSPPAPVVPLFILLSSLLRQAALYFCSTVTEEKGQGREQSSN